MQMEYLYLPDPGFQFDWQTILQTLFYIPCKQTKKFNQNWVSCFHKKTVNYSESNVCQ